MKRVNIIQLSFSSNTPHSAWAHRLSNSIVSLRDHGDNTIATHTIGDTSQLQSIDISYANFIPIPAEIHPTWQFHSSTQTVQSLKCTNKFITIGRTPDSLRNQYSRVLSLDQPNFDRMGTYKNETNSRTNASEVGATIVLSDKAAGQYQSWTLKYQRFQNVEGPFSFVNPDGVSISTEATVDMPCSPGMDL